MITKAPDNIKKLSFVLKTVERCNINCDYCYFFHGGDDSYKFHPPYISMQTIRETANFIRQGCIDLGIQFVSIGFHGGEPMMQKKSAFDEMCTIFQDILSPVATLEFNMQTNGMLVDEEWIKLLYKFKVAVGVSIDGPREYNDKHRIDKQGKGTHSRVVQGIETFMQNALIQEMGGIGLLCVINPEYDAKTIYRYFVDELGIKDIDFLLPDNTHDNLPQYSAIDYGNYLCELFDEWTADNDPKIHVRILESAINTFQGGQSLIYGVGYSYPHQLPLITISSNGDLGPVDELRTTTKVMMDTKSNVATASLAVLLQHPIFKKIAHAQLNVADDCQECCWKKICFSGSLVTRFSNEREFNNKSIYCEGLMKYFAHVASYMLRKGYVLDRLLKNIEIAV